MSARRRKFTTEFKVQAAHRVIDSGRLIAEVARELNVSEQSLGGWVRDERRRLEAAKGTEDEPLTPAERAELVRLRKQVAEQEKDLAFLGKAAAYFASNPPKRSDSR
ncbi:MAG: transposase [Actinomycetales bacterium]|nr:transposase [Actinomycetales bacterium]